jgi:SOS response regulatory protein OraA/RecX
LRQKRQNVEINEGTAKCRPFQFVSSPKGFAQGAICARLAGKLVAAASAELVGMSESFNLPLLRVWCRKKDAWLSFRTRTQDRYFINPYGYFVELPDEQLAQVTARVAFPLVNCYPSVHLSDLEVQSGFGSASYFVYALRENDVIGRPSEIKLSQLRMELEQILPAAQKLSPPERYVAIRVLEAGLITEDVLTSILRRLPPGRTLGQELVAADLIRWEVMLGACLDTRTPAHFDPPGPQKKNFLREWELAGEILIAMGRISRSKLEYALRVKRDGNRTIGEILTALGACSQDDIEKALLVQNAVRESRGADVGLVGELLVRRQIVTAEALQEALQRQKISGQPLANVLVTLGFITQADVDQYNVENSWQAFQVELEENNFASWLLTRRKITEEQLQHALAMRGKGRQVLGEILVAMGLCSIRDVEDTIRMQHETRMLSRSGIERLGSILMAKGKIDARQLEHAMLVQSDGRRALGEILMVIGGCSEKAVRIAIDIQGKWRQLMEQDDDRLGEVLMRRGFISEEVLMQAVQTQNEENKPFGRVLVERGWCTPEEIVATLLMRDYKRQCDLHAFIKTQLAQAKVALEDEGEQTERLPASILEQHRKGR